MLIFPEETDDDIFLDVYLTECEVRALAEKRMISQEVLGLFSTRKKIWIGLVLRDAFELPEEDE